MLAISQPSRHVVALQPLSRAEIGAWFSELRRFRTHTSYVRGNLVYGREFLGDADLADHCRRWLDETANVRVHGTTKELPRVRFERDELAALRPLAERPYCSVVLPPERATTTPSRLALPARDRIDVERRGLAAYAQLAETVEEVA